MMASHHQNNHQIWCPEAKKIDELYTSNSNDIAGAVSMTGEFIEPPLNFFLKLFSHRQAGLIRRENGNWRPMSPYYQVTDEEVISSISSKEGMYRAFALGIKERFYVIEIMQEDVDADPLIIPSLIGHLQKLNVKARVFRAGCSNVMQVFLYFDSKIKVSEVADGLHMFLHQSGFDTNKIRILKEDDCFALPLIDGFEFLNESYEPVIKRQEIALEPALALFMTQMVKVQSNATEFRETLRKSVQQEMDFSVPEVQPPRQARKTRLIQLALPVFKPEIVSAPESGNML
ncbi:MAG: hypothetical protein IPG59_09855 [Candidatus Melainabacteria bacterium]|nr:MAG: hypothetical protein IPG59_09855 [Candidatus Melainabacteria bacterium]